MKREVQEIERLRRVRAQRRVRAATRLSALATGVILASCTGTIEGPGGGNFDNPPGSSGGSTSSSGRGGETSSMMQGGSAPGGQTSVPQGGSSAPAGGNSGAPGAGGSGTQAPVYTDPGRVVMHRLNEYEYNNTVRDLFETAIRLPEAFPPDDAAYGFDNVAATLSLTDTHVGYYFDTAKALASEALGATRRAKILACDLKAQQEACVTSSLQSLLGRAWRAPATAEDISPLVDLYRTVRTQGSSEDEAFGRVLQAVLMSPRFLFRIERNKSDGSSGPRDLDGYELASRLSYFLWSSMPDKALFDAAAANRLSSVSDIQAQVTRMLADGKAKALQNFGEQWLSVRNLQNVAPDKQFFPSFDEELRGAMRQETMLLFNDLITGKESLDKLLTSNFSYLNDRLAKHYGLPAVGSATPVRTMLPADSKRGGLFTQASWLTVYARPNETNPVKRGNWILDQTLCIEVKPPPFVVSEEPEKEPGQTRRETLAAHVNEPVCAACHKLMDPPGLALEQYDAVGAFRTQDNNVAIRVDGTLPNGTAFSDAIDMAKKIAATPEFPRCVARHTFIYALGRGDRPSSMDSDVIDKVTASFISGGQKFPTLLEAIATSDVFRKRQDAN
ncbi:MAG: DUF1592 domain-containing protein [Myxococcota bacterium]